MLRQVGSQRFQVDRCILNGTVLGIMHDAMDGSEYFRVSRRGTNRNQTQNQCKNKF
jgi:hypothetical protein